MKKLQTILPLLLFIYILAETILKANNIELCSSTGCALAGDLLKFNSTYLNYLGMAGALFLVVLSVFKSDIAKRLYIVVLVAMVIFESLLIASQINLNPEPCKFCLGVYTFLLVTLIATNLRVFLYILPSIAAIFFAFSILAIPKNKSLIKEDGVYLIASKTCPHCKVAKEFLDKNGVKYSVIDSKDINAFYFAKTLGIKKIPILIDKNGYKVRVLVGDKEIENSFLEKKEQPTKSVESQNQVEYAPKLNYGDDEGCSFSVTQESSCEEESR